ncbi:MAG: hypothetical protein CVU16_09195 [Betaproteobacteria bacterium HGW-Betaproteobacteria-10]|nr:MAG: hypothetical protein CVU16_09195 [Betaproteobacteria bacterium HGW-Betaproteobacteria-10]
MITPPASTSSPAPETIIKNLLEWLALAHGRTGAEDAKELYEQTQLLRQAPIPTAQRVKFLDLLYSQAERVVSAELRTLREISLPASRKLRQRMKLVLDLLTTLTQDYFNTLAELFDPNGNNTLRAPQLSLRRAMEAIAWQIRINHLLASPPGLGLWQQLHAAFRNARRLGLEHIPGSGHGASIQRIYTDILLAAIAQPASFSSAELEFISDYIEQSRTFLDRSKQGFSRSRTDSADTCKRYQCPLFFLRCACPDNRQASDSTKTRSFRRQPWFTGICRNPCRARRFATPHGTLGTSSQTKIPQAPSILPGLSLRWPRQTLATHQITGRKR